MKNRTKSVLAIAIVNVLATSYSPALLAQESTDDTEIIEVKGFRSSVIKAKDLKREALIAQDSIVAEDIADFPDLNLADSLQRVPGVAITREGGEGRQISLRGMGPDFTRVEVNGMEALGTSSSPMDSRGAVGRSRAFDFNIFASELFNQIDVKKSYSADMEEGGIGGTVGLHTARPFNYKGFQSLVGVQGGTNTNTDSFDQRLVGMISNTWDNFGALASIAYSTKESREMGYNTYRWRKRSTSNYNDSLDSQTQALLEDGELWFSRGNRYSVWNNQQDRLGVTAALQYRASDDLEFSLDFLHGKLENTLDEHHISTGGSSSTALGFVEELDYVDNNGDKEVVFARYSNSTIRTESREDYNESIFDQVTLQSKWTISDELKMVAQIGTSQSDYNQPKVNKANLTRSGGITTDFTQDRFYGVNTYDFDPTSLDGWAVKDLYFQEDYITTDFDNAKVDFEYLVGDSGVLTFGANYKKFSNSGERRQDSGYVENKAPPLNADVKTVTADITEVYSDHPDQSWLQLDMDAVKAFYGLSDLSLGEDKIISTSAFKVQEETQAAYAQYTWDNMLGDSLLRGNIGLRYYNTELTSNGVSQGEQIEIIRDYSGVLPSLNLSYEVMDDVLLRFGASKNLTRPSLSTLSVSANVSQATLSEGDVGSVTVGNPSLKPYSSVNIDTSIESYFDGVGFLSAAVFYKDIKDFIVTETLAETFTLAELGLPNSLLPNGGTPTSQFNVTSPQNSDSSTIKGFEFAFQRDLDFLPAPFDKLGVIANYTWADGSSKYRNVQNSGQDQVKAFTGLSKSSYNMTLYYETDSWGARIAAAYRDRFISSVEAGLGDEDERGFHETTYVDFSAFYQVNESIKINIEGINLTNQREEQYSDSSDRQYNTTTSGRTYMAGVTYKF
ncbi:MAG: TonB-dependent receptor [Paraglaciecola sp.]|uniref:TonB-dependent receptor n=1 Tax=Paraglaciecola sp. TaxID=1920173 RepID=UPI00273F840E|nr:TonB-dependent receptor [Paraglaciecola sp.]MDP5033291.1 TonB-dependent receptor [Paraglaciecola sp.]MDP5129783.1 TonB-dependent receptor [Paraglaciecola sp.]